ncbi:hypothetical protein ABZT51_47240, partial [Streptomyces sp. NPDC005373]
TMLITHALEDDTLHVALHGQLDITSRTAAAVEIEALVRDRHPHRVTVQIPAGEPNFQNPHLGALLAGCLSEGEQGRWLPLCAPFRAERRSAYRGD